MSKLAVKLYAERELLAEGEKHTAKDNYSSLLCAVFGEREFDSALNEDVHFQAEIESSLFSLEQSNPYGMLQRYFVEEYFLHGKSKEEIGKRIWIFCFPIWKQPLFVSSAVRNRPKSWLSTFRNKETVQCFRMKDICKSKKSCLITLFLPKS